MPGLAGILRFRDTVDLAQTERLVKKMGRVQSHRGPGPWQVLSQLGLVYVAPRGESITINDERVRVQPEQSGGPFLAFDGEITNRNEIRNLLSQAGKQFRSENDRSLVLLAWEHWGEKCLDHLDGRFAFVLHDPAKRTSYLVRDRFGHRPFHYAFSDERICFASEIKTLLSVLHTHGLDELALLEWSLYGDLLPPRTLFKGIRTLAPGHLLKVGMDGRNQQTLEYYDPVRVVDPTLYADYAAKPKSEILAILEQTIEQAVTSHLGGRPEVGIMLSGGVDSTVIGALASRHAKMRAYCFSVQGDPRLDERPMAKEVARIFGFPLKTILIDGKAYRQGLAHATLQYEMPLWHMQGVPIHLLARCAHQDETSLLLSGVSVGPLLGAATDRYRWLLPSTLLKRVPEDIFRILRKAVYSAAGLPTVNPFFNLNLGVGLQLVDGGSRSRLVDRYNKAYEFLGDLNERRIQLMRLSDNTLFLRRFFYQNDRLCMGESVEYCDASVEARFMMLALNLPSKFIFHKNRISKWILKEFATKFVPREIAFQKKIPLDVPIGVYFEPIFKKSFFEKGFMESMLGLDWNTANILLEKAREQRPLLQQLVHIETWGKLFFMQQSVEEVQSLIIQ